MVALEQSHVEILLSDQILELAPEEVDRLLDLIAQVQKVEVGLVEKDVEKEVRVHLGEVGQLALELLDGRLGIARPQIKDVDKHVLLLQPLKVLGRKLIEAIVFARDFEVRYFEETRGVLDSRRICSGLEV
jgi:hypothetical protein